VMCLDGGSGWFGCLSTCETDVVPNGRLARLAVDLGADFEPYLA
jgi:hypothetical protein